MSEEFEKKGIVQRIIFVIFVLGAVFGLLTSVYIMGGSNMCEDSGGTLFEKDGGLVCIILNNTDRCVDISGNVRSKSWVDDIVFNVSGVGD